MATTVLSVAASAVQVIEWTYTHNKYGYINSLTGALITDHSKMRTVPYLDTSTGETGVYHKGHFYPGARIIRTAEGIIVDTSI